MKTTSKTFFGLMTVGLLLTAVGQSNSLAQSAPAAEKPMREDVLKILCQRFPLNSRCEGSANSQAAPAAPASSGTTMPETKTETKTETPKEDKPDAMAPAAAPEPTGGGTLPGASADPMKPDPASTTDAPKTPEPTKPEGEVKPKEPTK